MDYKIILSEVFLKDLKEIVDYLTQEAGEETAAHVANSIVNCAYQTAPNPFIGKPVNHPQKVRKVSCRPYLIYYKINQEERAVEIIRAWHGARNPRSLKLG